MVLRNFDSANEYYNIDTGKRARFDTDQKINDWYKLVNGIISALLAENSQLFIVWDKNKYLINEKTTVRLADSTINGERKLSFYISSSLVFEFHYPVEADYSNVSPFEYIDSEDFDWGIFVSNVINDESRTKNFIENLIN